MKYIALNQNVYIVDGYRKSAIYDLNTGNLYSINRATRDLIRSALAQNFCMGNGSGEEKRQLRSLLSKKILAFSPIPKAEENIRNLKLDYPCRFAWIEVTRQCNHQCVFCYEKSGPSCHSRMSFAAFVQVVKNLKEVGIKKIQFIGGEPLLLGNRLKKMIEFSRKDFTFIEVYSNGVLINDAWCDFFQKFNIHIALSVHSYIPAEHDKLVQRPGAHRKVTLAIQRLKQHHTPYRIAAIQNRTCKLGTATPETPYRIHVSDPKITGRSDFSHYDFEMFQRKVITQSSMQRPLNKMAVSLATTGHRCFMKNFYVSSDLRVYPCVMERRYDYGQLKNKTLKKMLTDRLRFLTKDQIEGCQECEYRYHCFDCRPDANGRGLYQKPWYCSYNPRTGRWAKLKPMFNQLKNACVLN